MNIEEKIAKQLNEISFIRCLAEYVYEKHGRTSDWIKNLIIENIQSYFTPFQREFQEIAKNHIKKGIILSRYKDNFNIRISFSFSIEAFSFEALIDKTYIFSMINEKEIYENNVYLGYKDECDFIWTTEHPIMPPPATPADIENLNKCYQEIIAVLEKYGCSLSTENEDTIYLEVKNDSEWWKNRIAIYE